MPIFPTGACASSIKCQIKVFCRVKPIEGPYSAFKVDSNPKSLDENGNGTDFLHIAPKHIAYPLKNQLNSSKTPSTKAEFYSFGFAKIFDPSYTQEDIFNLAATPIIESVLDGFNGTIFAYGQTGTGKTFTMTGDFMDAELRGIIPRTLYYVFREVKNCNTIGNKITSLSISFLEIYNDVMYDLLGNTSSFARKLEDLEKVSFVNNELRNLTKFPLNSEDEAYQLLELGNSNRATAETSLNQASTRSHCIFTIYISGNRECPGPANMSSSTVPFSSKLHLVDLAGSERIVRNSLNEQTLTLIESKAINLSLSYLEQVITALNEPGRTHIPYRNSTLTAVLKDSLGGNSLTTFLATVSLEQKYVQETLSTCRFMQRVGKVKNIVVRNEKFVQFKPDVEYFAHKEAENPIGIAESKDEICGTIKPPPTIPIDIAEEDRPNIVQLVNNLLESNDIESIIRSFSNSNDMQMLSDCFGLLRMEVIGRRTEIHHLLNEIRKHNDTIDGLHTLLRHYKNFINCPHCAETRIEPNNNNICFPIVQDQKNIGESFIQKNMEIEHSKLEANPIPQLQSQTELPPVPPRDRSRHPSSVSWGIFSPPNTVRQILLNSGPSIFVIIYDAIMSIFSEEEESQPDPAIAEANDEHGQ